jgi:hypothetical protein
MDGHDEGFAEHSGEGGVFIQDEQDGEGNLQKKMEKVFDHEKRKEFRISLVE